MMVLLETRAQITKIVMIFSKIQDKLPGINNIHKIIMINNKREMINLIIVNVMDKKEKKKNKMNKKILGILL